MAVRPLRRIGAATSDSLYDRMQVQFLRPPVWRRDADAVERDHPDLIVRSGDNVLAAIPRGGSVALLYGFDNERAFRDLFPLMLEELLPALRASRDCVSLRFRLSYAPGRPVIEPVLRGLWFKPVRDWLSFSLGAKTKLPVSTVPGIKFRDGVAGDFDELLRIDAEAFPDSAIDPQHVRESLNNDSALIATSGREIAGFCLSNMPDPSAGWISILAVSHAQRGRGIGAALTVRAAKRMFADGAERVGLTTDVDNGEAIRLYVGLGFKQTEAGRDYTRPVDAAAIEQLKAEGQGTFIKFGGWR